MCKFFSVTSDGNGDIRYFDWELRKKILSGELNYGADSHTSINDYFGYQGAAEDTRNKYEYNPLTKKFVIDAINCNDDSEIVKEKVMALDFKTIVKPLIVKSIINPFLMDTADLTVTDKHIELLREWASVKSSVWGSVRDSVRGSVRGSVWSSVSSSVWYSIWDSVWSSVWDSVRGSVCGSVRDSVRDSVWDSVSAYMSSFFELDAWILDNKTLSTNPFRSCIDLWKMGLVPSFNGKTWRLHTGADARIVYEIEKEKLYENTNS